MTFDILRYEARGTDFALVRITADGTRAEIILTPMNVVHLGLLAPQFSRRLLGDEIGKQPSRIAAFVKHGTVNTKLRIVEVLLSTANKSGRRLDFLLTEQKARALAARLIDKANSLAKVPKLS